MASHIQASWWWTTFIFPQFCGFQISSRDVPVWGTILDGFWLCCFKERLQFDFSGLGSTFPGSLWEQSFCFMFQLVIKSWEPLILNLLVSGVYFLDEFWTNIRLQLLKDSKQRACFRCHLVFKAEQFFNQLFIQARYAL